MTTMPDHLGDLLSALLDAELPTPEELDARRHLATCRQCTIELDHISAARAWVRALPPVEPPVGFIERLIREQEEAQAGPSWRPWASRWAGVAAFAASAAAAVSLIGLASPKEAPIQPSVSRLVEAHATGASLSGDPLSRLAPVGVPVTFRR